MLPAESPGLYQLAQREAAAAVTATAELPPLPTPVWNAPEPSAVALEHGAEQTYLAMQRQQARFALCHQIGTLLRSVGGLGAQVLLLGGVPEVHGFTFKRWDLALAGVQETKRLKAPLRLRYAIDHGWQPGLWLAGDVSATPVEVKVDRRRLLRGWVSR
jgi:hypothetical protein